MTDKELYALAQFEQPATQNAGKPVIDVALALSGYPSTPTLLKARHELGLVRYGQPLMTLGGRYTDAQIVQELADALMYSAKGYAASGDARYKRLFAAVEVVLVNAIGLAEANA